MITNIKFMLGFVKKYGYVYLILTLLFSMTSLLSPLVDTLFPKFIVDALVNSQFNQTLFILIAATFCIQLLNQGAYSWFLSHYVPKAEYHIKQGVKTELFEHVAHLDLNYFENTENYNQYTLALKEVDQRVTYLMQTIGGLLNSLFYLTTLAIIILTLNPVLLILSVISTAISFTCNHYLSKLRYTYQMELNPLQRKEQYVSRIFYEPQYAKDVRFFSLFQLLGPFFHQNATQTKTTIQKHTAKIAALDFIMNFLKGPLLQVLIMTYLIYSIFNGTSTIGDFTALLLATIQMGNQLYGLTFQFNQLHEHSLYIENLRKILDVKPIIETQTGKDIELSGNVELKNISFHYEGQTENTLTNISLSIKAGEKIGIVGHNGAGKTTLIKLLTRLYDANEGDLLIDGINHKDLNVTTLRNQIGLVFQDIPYYPHSIAENLLFRPLQTDEEEVKIWEALKKVNLYDKVQALPKGIHSSLSKEFEEDGVMFSGGELQKLAIARIYLNDYKLLLLDEPSSALDPFAEHEIATQMLESAQDKTVIMISHKLSLTKNLDRIYVLEQGQITESGAHDELMAQNGIYAEMFNLQLENYTN